MTPTERAAAWEALQEALVNAHLAVPIRTEFHHAALALDAYEALRADDDRRVTGVLRPGYEDDTRALQALADELCAVTEALPDDVLAEDRSLADSVRMLLARRCGTCLWWDQFVALGGLGICGNTTSECEGRGWTAQHGCPHFEVRR